MSPNRRRRSAEKYCSLVIWEPTIQAKPLNRGLKISQTRSDANIVPSISKTYLTRITSFPMRLWGSSLASRNTEARGGQTWLFRTSRHDLVCCYLTCWHRPSSKYPSERGSCWCWDLPMWTNPCADISPNTIAVLLISTPSPLFPKFGSDNF